MEWSEGGSNREVMEARWIDQAWKVAGFGACNSHQELTSNVDLICLHRSIQI